MDVCQFALYKFKTIEGLLRNAKGLDFNATEITSGFKTYIINYDMANHTCTIKNKFEENGKVVNCTFKDLPDKLKEMKLWDARSESEMHSNALIPYDGKL